MNQPMTDDDSMNLSKYLSSAGVCSRRGAAELVAGGAVAVNGTTAQSPGQRVTRKDRVTLHGKPVAPSGNTSISCFINRAVMSVQWKIPMQRRKQSI